MSLAAEGLGLGSVIIGCIREYMNSKAGEKWAKRFGLPEDQKFAIGLALGYKDKETPVHPIKEGRSIIIN
jgi:nitroreductase